MKDVILCPTFLKVSMPICGFRNKSKLLDFLRHSVATYLLEEGVDIIYIQKILGRSFIKTTQIYLHIVSKKQMEILKKLHPRNRMKIGSMA